jgi:hypothetical protein
LVYGCPLTLRREHGECDVVPEELLNVPAEKDVLHQGLVCTLFLLDLNPQTITAPRLIVEPHFLGCLLLRPPPAMP